MSRIGLAIAAFFRILFDKAFADAIRRVRERPGEIAAPAQPQPVVQVSPAGTEPLGLLTREAAFNAGFPEQSILLEEPQAALYSWLADIGEKWRKQLNVGDTRCWYATSAVAPLISR